MMRSRGVLGFVAVARHVQRWKRNGVEVRGIDASTSRLEVRLDVPGVDAR